MTSHSVATETIVLAGLCLLDMAWTILAVLSGIAVEANPLLAWTFGYGPLAFALVKVASLAPGLVVIEYCRLTNPQFAIWAARMGIVGYCFIYFAGSLRLHGLL